jgi:anti-repressor protein
MKELKIFKHEAFGQVRVVEKDGEPWFYASDVAKALGYEYPKDAVRAHCKKVNKFSGGESPPPAVPYNIIPESDVYRLIMRSNMPEAVKFQDWFMEVVLPDIRKHGVYMTDNFIEKAIADPDLIIRLATELKEQRAQVAALTEKAAKDAPMVQLGEHVVGSEGNLTMGEFAKFISRSPFVIGRTQMFRWMRKEGYFFLNHAGHNEPYQRFVTQGLFLITYETVKKGKFSEVVPVIFMTPKGAANFLPIFKAMSLEDLWLAVR